jgi:GTP-binding protein HflX
VERIPDTTPRALVVGVEPRPLGADEERVGFYDELDLLIAGAGLAPAGRRIHVRADPDPDRFLSRGALAALADTLSPPSDAQRPADCVVAACELRPRQHAALTAALPVPVHDRTEVILEIFAARARSRAGQLQVERARLAYRLPRLAGGRDHLSRLGGGTGTRGPGETALEFDRRRIRQRMARLDRELADLAVRRERSRRARGDLPTVAVVGYTNAGKTSLIGRLCGGDLAGNDRLFDTLDPAVRRAELPESGPILLVDTVGFVRDLPAGLRQAFAATLEEVTAADALLCLASAAASDPLGDLEAVEAVLAQIGAADLPRVLALSQADRAAGPAASHLMAGGPPLWVSSITGAGLADLDAALARALAGRRVRVSVRLPLAGAARTEAWARRRGRVLSADYRAEGATLELELTAADAARALAGTPGRPPAAR